MASFFKLLVKFQHNVFCGTRFVNFSQSGCFSFVQIILDAGVDVNIRNMHNTIPLHLALAKGAKPCVKLLLSAGANCNLQVGPHISKCYVSNYYYYYFLISMFPLFMQFSKNLIFVACNVFLEKMVKMLTFPVYVVRV